MPFASIAAFFAIYLGLVNNQNFSRFVRWVGGVVLWAARRLVGQATAAVERGTPLPGRSAAASHPATPAAG